MRSADSRCVQWWYVFPTQKSYSHVRSMTLLILPPNLLSCPCIRISIRTIRSHSCLSLLPLNEPHRTLPYFSGPHTCCVRVSGSADLLHLRTHWDQGVDHQQGHDGPTGMSSLMSTSCMFYNLIHPIHRIVFLTIRNSFESRLIVWSRDVLRKFSRFLIFLICFRLRVLSTLISKKVSLERKQLVMMIWRNLAARRRSKKLDYSEVRVATTSWEKEILFCSDLMFK